MDRKELDFKIMSGMAWMPLQLLAESIGISAKKLRRIFCKFSREVVISRAVNSFSLGEDGELILARGELMLGASRGMKGSKMPRRGQRCYSVPD